MGLQTEDWTLTESFPNTTVKCTRCDMELRGGDCYNVDEAVTFHAIGHAQGLFKKKKGAKQ